MAGWYGGQLIMSLPHGEATFYSQAILECAIAAIVCIADMIIGIVGEWLCQIPPIDGPESPKMKTPRNETVTRPRQPNRQPKRKPDCPYFFKSSSGTRIIAS